MDTMWNNCDKLFVKLSTFKILSYHMNITWDCWEFVHPFSGSQPNGLKSHICLFVLLTLCLRTLSWIPLLNISLWMTPLHLRILKIGQVQWFELWMKACWTPEHHKSELSTWAMVLSRGVLRACNWEVDVFLFEVHMAIWEESIGLHLTTHRGIIVQIFACSCRELFGSI